MQRVARAGFLNDVFLVIDQILPRATVPVVVTHKPQNSGPKLVQCNIVRVVDLAKKMGRIGVVISARTVERTPNVASRTNPQVRPSLPLCDRIEAERNLRWPLRRRRPPLRAYASRK